MEMMLGIANYWSSLAISVLLFCVEARQQKSSLEYV